MSHLLSLKLKQPVVISSRKRLIDTSVHFAVFTFRNFHRLRISNIHRRLFNFHERVRKTRKGNHGLQDVILTVVGGQEKATNFSSLHSNLPLVFSLKGGSQTVPDCKGLDRRVHDIHSGMLSRVC